MSRWKKNRRHRKPRPLGTAPLAAVGDALPIVDMPTLLMSYVDAQGEEHLMLLSKPGVRLLNIMRRNRAIYVAGTPAVLRTRLLEQALRQSHDNPNTYIPYLRGMQYHTGLGGRPVLLLQLTESGFKTFATWFSVGQGNLLDVKPHDLHQFDEKLKTDFSDELRHALKMLGYM